MEIELWQMPQPKIINPFLGYKCIITEAFLPAVQI
jgi:hypothetical protein